MKKLFLIFCSFLFSFAYSQKETNYVFNVQLSDRNQAPTFTPKNGVLTYNGTDSVEKTFFAKYTIYEFYATYPNYSGYLLNVFTFITSSSSLMNDLKTQFPIKYLTTEDLTNDHVQLVSSYPNDYGNGVNYVNPVPNLGANISLKSFDYVNTPKAWGFFPNNTPKGNVTIGISDGMVDNSDQDFLGKVTYLHQNQFYPYFGCGTEAWHGTGVGAIAAAQGDNSHGIAGVCYDCTIMNIPYQVDHINYAQTANFPGLMEMAQLGVRVINMSWIQGYQDYDMTYIAGFHQTQQEAINQLFNKGVVLVAGAGNDSSYMTYLQPNYQKYCYPASYDHVISVTVVNAKNAHIGDQQVTIPTYGAVSQNDEDIICNSGAINYMGNSYYPFSNASTTTNSRVDICGPGYAPMYPSYVLGCLDGDGNPDLYGTATSAATPFVTGTVALMQSLNSCILPGEVEDILQLTSKNLEIKPENVNFIGRSGSGKLETGDAVEFTHEMMDSSGNALIDGQDFWRFNFDLKHIYNNLTISNQIFRDGNTSNFTAKNAIDVLENSDFRPNADGFVDLNIDSAIVLCDAIQEPKGANTIKQERPKVITSSIKLFPNPNKGLFTIMLNQKEIKDLSITVFDILGKQVYEIKSNETIFDVNIPNLPVGLYLVKLSSDTINETLKFVKE